MMLSVLDLGSERKKSPISMAIHDCHLHQQCHLPADVRSSRTLCWQRPCSVGTLTHRKVKGLVQSHTATPVETELGSLWLQIPPHPNYGQPCFARKKSQHTILKV